MPEESPKKSLFKSLFGFGSPKPETPNNPAPVTPTPNPPSGEAPQVKTEKADSNSESAQPNHGSRLVASPQAPLPQTEAYQSRKKGRKLHRDSWQDLQTLLAAIQSRGEAVPGDLAAELGASRSTLAYNLNRLVKEGRIERLGGGRSIRYRVTQAPTK